MLKEIVNLEKLNQINDSLATEDADKKLLKNCYQQALNEINNLEKETKTLVDLAEELNTITCLLRQIQCRCGINTNLKEPFMLSDAIDNTIDILKESLQEGLSELSNHDYRDIDSVLAKLDDNIYILNRDLTKGHIDNTKTLYYLNNNELFSPNSNRLLFDNIASISSGLKYTIFCSNIISSSTTLLSNNE